MAILAIRGLKLVIQIDEHMGAEAGDTWCFWCVCRCSYEGTYPELDETPSHTVGRLASLRLCKESIASL